MTYNPFDWYWNNPVAAQVFSSARQAWVAYADGAYQAWLTAGNLATAYTTDADLRAALAPYGIGLTPQETARLQPFANFVNRPWLIGRLLYRLVRLLVANGALTQAQATGLLGTTEQTDPTS